MATKASGLKTYGMKAGKEGPMKKNFPSVFKHRGVPGQPHTHDEDSDIDYTSGETIRTGPRGGTTESSQYQGEDEHDKVEITSASWGRTDHNRRKLFTSAKKDSGYDHAQRGKITDYWESKKFTT